MKTGLSRRQFIKSNVAAALAASAFPSIIPASALGRDGTVAPSERVVLGAIGVGTQGQGVLRGFLNHPQCQVVALCDVKADRLEEAKGIVDEAYGNTDCATTGDFRDLNARADIDAVLIASPDHWHVVHALSAVRSGKDIYLEKPLGMSLEQGQAVRAEVKRCKRIFQFGTQQRSSHRFRLACELVRNRCIGNLKHINVWAPGSLQGGTANVVPPPPTVNYDLWLGPAPWREHTQDITDRRPLEPNQTWSPAHWYFVSDFSLGFVAGWGIHPLDIALWGAGELASGVVEVQGTGVFPSEGLYDTATEWEIDFTFESGLTMKSTSSPDGKRFADNLEAEWTARYGKVKPHGTAFEGEDGWIRVDRESIATSPEDLVELALEPDKLPIALLRSPNHPLNFLRSVKSREITVSDIDSAVQSDAFCHISDVALRLGRPLRYDGRKERFLGDREANRRLQHRPMRHPWKI